MRVLGPEGGSLCKVLEFTRNPLKRPAVVSVILALGVETQGTLELNFRLSERHGLLFLMPAYPMMLPASLELQTTLLWCHQ